MVKLFIECGPYTGESFELGAGRFAIGRSSKADISLPALPVSISREHLHIEVKYDSVMVENVGKSGSKLNSEPLTRPTQLQVGQRISMNTCDTVFVVQEILFEKDAMTSDDSEEFERTMEEPLPSMHEVFTQSPRTYDDHTDDDPIEFGFEPKPAPTPKPKKPVMEDNPVASEEFSSLIINGKQDFNDDDAVLESRALSLDDLNLISNLNLDEPHDDDQDFGPLSGTFDMIAHNADPSESILDSHEYNLQSDLFNIQQHEDEHEPSKISRNDSGRVSTDSTANIDKTGGITPEMVDYLRRMQQKKRRTRIIVTVISIIAVMILVAAVIWLSL